MQMCTRASDKEGIYWFKRLITSIVVTEDEEKEAPCEHKKSTVLICKVPKLNVILKEVKTKSNIASKQTSTIVHSQTSLLGQIFLLSMNWWCSLSFPVRVWFFYADAEMVTLTLNKQQNTERHFYFLYYHRSPFFKFLLKQWSRGLN